MNRKPLMSRRHKRLINKTIHKILGSVTDNYVFYLMHAYEYAHWISLGINCQEYADKKQIYVVSHYDELKK